VALLLPFRGRSPQIAPDAFLAPTAVVLGDVRLGAGASVWFGAVLRGDHREYGIVVGERSNIQDNCVVHVGDWQPTLIGAEVTVGHGAKLESCTIEDRCVVGMNAVILPEAVIGAGSLVAAGAVVLEGTRVPPGSLVAGVPARVRGSLQGPAVRWVERSSRHYAELTGLYREEGIGRQAVCRRCGRPVPERQGEVACPTCGEQRNGSNA
jgi:carbonic anhydrase/acetyltransferase-like protein (isoleucine patch superfamily)